MIHIYQMDDLNIIESDLLRKRALRAQSKRTLEFLTTFNESEAAFLSLENCSDKLIGFIYEIYVLPEFRNKNLGAALIARAEEVAITLGCNLLQLDVRSLDHTIDNTFLYSWYSKKGFKSQYGKVERMEKIIT